jgi:hypothetical protein
MRVKIELVKDDRVDENSTISVETHTRRGDAFNIHRATSSIPGEPQTVDVPPGGRIVINTPMSTEQPVYDREQGAAVMASNQVQGREGSDRADPNEVVRLKEEELRVAKENAERVRDQNEREAQAAAQASRTPPQGGQPLAPTNTAAQQAGAPVTKPGSPATPVAGAAAGTKTVDASKAPDPSTGHSTPGASTEKK